MNTWLGGGERVEIVGNRQGKGAWKRTSELVLPLTTNSLVSGTSRREVVGGSVIRVGEADGETQTDRQTD